jgi:hypothetical protein
MGNRESRRDAIVRPVRIGRKVFLDRDEIDTLIAKGGKMRCFPRRPRQRRPDSTQTL